MVEGKNLQITSITHGKKKKRGGGKSVIDCRNKWGKKSAILPIDCKSSNKFNKIALKKKNILNTK